MDSETSEITTEMKAQDLASEEVTIEAITPEASAGAECVVLSDLNITRIKRELLQADPNQVRKEFPETHINSLRKSIEEDGLRDPLDVVPIPSKEGEEQHYLIVDGECRFRATEGILDELPCIILTEETAKSWSLKANLLRKDLNPMEKSDCLFRYLKSANLLDKDGKAVRKALNIISSSYNISPSMVTELYSLQKLPIEIQDEQRKNGFIPLRKIKKLATNTMLEDEERRSELYKELVAKYTPKEAKKPTKRDKTKPNKIILKHIEGVKSKAENTLQYYAKIDFSRYSPEESQKLGESLCAALETFTQIQKIIETKLEELTSVPTTIEGQ